VVDARRSTSRPVASAIVAALVLALAAAPAAGEDHDPRIVAVGDIACQSLTQGDGEGACRSDEVAELIRSLEPDRFLALGDLQYNSGSAREFARVWEVQFGDLRSITMPAPGNHEYVTEGAAGYFGYFGAKAHPPEGYYSFDLGAWHIVSLNSEICGDDPGCGPGSPQYEWLQGDLAEHDTACTLAFQHHPPKDWRPFEKWVDADATTKYGGSETAPYIELWRLMDRLGVDVLLVGHNHIYHRWAPQDAEGERTADGIRQFTVGTGGRSLYPYGPKPRPENLVAAQRKSFGVLEMTLHDASYDYRWVGLPGDPVFVDQGAFACR
jgi:hypothetical protein